jgi:hypothetical protein
MKAAFGLRFLPAFFAFFFAISVSPLNGIRCSIRDFSPLTCSGDEKMPNPEWRVNDFPREKRRIPE